MTAIIKEIAEEKMTEEENSVNLSEEYYKEVWLPVAMVREDAKVRFSYCGDVLITLKSFLNDVVLNILIVTAPSNDYVIVTEFTDEKTATRFFKLVDGQWKIFN